MYPPPSVSSLSAKPSRLSVRRARRTRSQEAMGEPPRSGTLPVPIGRRSKASSCKSSWKPRAESLSQLLPSTWKRKRPEVKLAAMAVPSHQPNREFACIFARRRGGDSSPVHDLEECLFILGRLAYDVVGAIRPSIGLDAWAYNLRGMRPARYDNRPASHACRIAHAM